MTRFPWSLLPLHVCSGSSIGSVLAQLDLRMMEQQQPVRRRYFRKQQPRPSDCVLVCQPLAAQQLQLVPVSPPYQPKGPKRKRTRWTGTRVRVQFAGQRLSCSASLRGALMARLQQERASRASWSGLRWERVVRQVAKEDWGARTHGGNRKNLQSEASSRWRTAGSV